MPRGEVNRNACSLCRRKRKKCNGNIANPCSTCLTGNVECVFEEKRQQTKAELKLEVQRLSQSLAHNRSILQLLRSGENSEFVLSLLKRGDTIESIAAQLAQLPQASHASEVNGVRLAPAGSHLTRQPLSPHESLSSESRSSGSKDYSRLGSIRDNSSSALGGSLAGQSDSPSQAGSFVLQNFPCTWESQSLSTIANDSDIAPNDSLSPESRPIPVNWTTTSFSSEAVTKLLQVFFRSGFYPVLERALFERDYAEGTGPYCSRALINTMLALASRLSEDALDVSRRGDDPPTWSKRFFQESMQQLLKLEVPYVNLPDIQATALCSLYQLSDGFENEAQTLAGQAADFATSYVEMDRKAFGDDKHHSVVRDITLCGAVSLARMIYFSSNETRRLSGGSVPSQSHRKAFSASLGRNLPLLQHVAPCHQIAGGSENHNDHQPGDIGYQDMCNHFHKLTELVYLVEEPVDAGINSMASDNLLDTYRQCLEWYDGISSHLHLNEFAGPFTTFIDVHYHFCLLALWRPSVDLTLNNTRISPRDICYDASKAILMLTASPASLTHLQSVPYFMPYFIYAAGNLQLHLLQTALGEPLNIGPGRPSIRGDGRQLVSKAILQLGQVSIGSKFSGEAELSLKNEFDMWRHPAGSNNDISGEA